MISLRHIVRMGVARALALGWLSLSASAVIDSADVSAQASVGAQASGQWVRVAVARNHPHIELAVYGRFRILALPSTESLREGHRLPRVAVRANREGIMVGNDVFPLGGVRVEPSRDATIHLNGQRLRGTIEIFRQADQTLLVVNHVDLEEYLQGVLSKEAPHDWPREALRALAIAARTYTLFQLLSKSAVEYDVTSDVMSQVYGGKSAEKRRTTRAVADTRGFIVTYRGRVFPTFYHSTCGGLTEHASVMGSYEVEPLQGRVACSFCRNSPFYRWQRRLTAADVGWALSRKGYGSVGGVKDLTIAARTSTGRAAQFLIRGATRNLSMTGYEFRALFGFEHLRSTEVVIEPQWEAFLLHGRGWGHGVGLCQWGTAELAKRGLTAPEILAFYYPHSEMNRLGEGTLQPIVGQGGA